MKRTLLAFLLAASVLMPQAAFAQQSTVGAEAETEEPKAAYGPGDIDLLLSLGLGGFLYPHAEPSIDVGLIPIGDMTVSVGGGIDVGWCALCAVTSAVSGVTIASQYFAPFGRVNLHLGTLGGALDAEMDGFTIDPYVGAFAGPTIYRWTFKFDDETANANATQTSLLFGPAAGARLGLANNRVLITGEFRFNLEIGFGSVTVEDSQGNVYYDDTDAFTRGGTDFILGIGFRI
jgi:hypothetical protein